VLILLLGNFRSAIIVSLRAAALGPGGIHHDAEHRAVGEPDVVGRTGHRDRNGWWTARSSWLKHPPSSNRKANNRRGTIPVHQNTNNLDGGNRGERPIPFWDRDHLPCPCLFNRCNGMKRMYRDPKRIAGSTFCCRRQDYLCFGGRGLSSAVVRFRLDDGGFFNHDDRAVHHSFDPDGQSAQRHQVRPTARCSASMMNAARAETAARGRRWMALPKIAQ